MTKTSLLMLAATSGWVATGSAATVYNETIGGDLSSNTASPTVLTSGTDSVLGSITEQTDPSDSFIITDLVAGGTADFDFSAVHNDFTFAVFFTFSDPAGSTLYTSPNYYADAVGNTGNLTVPASGQMKISVQFFSTSESGSTPTTWSVSTNDVVPETSVTALAALGALLAMRRKRN